MRIRSFLLPLVLGCALGWGAPSPYEGSDPEAAAFWRESVWGRERRVLDSSVAWVGRTLMLCPGGSWAPEDIAALGTILMYESTGRPQDDARRQHWNPAFAEEGFLDLGEMLMGEPLSGERERAVRQAYAEYLKGARFRGVASVSKGSRLAPLTLAVYDNVLGRKRDFAKALDNLRSRMGWAFELEEMAAPAAAEAIRRGLRRDIPFLFEAKKGTWYLGLAFRESGSGEFSVLLGEVDRFRPLGLSHWEAKGGDKGHAHLPPGSGPWDASVGDTKRPIPFDTMLGPDLELPPNFHLVSLPLPEGTVFWIHGMRPDGEGRLARVVSALGIPAGLAKDLPGEGDGESADLWRQHVRGRGITPICGEWGIVHGLPLVPTADGAGVRTAALVGVVLGTWPGRTLPDGFGFGQKEFLTAVRDARWQSLPADKQAALWDYYCYNRGAVSNAKDRRLRVMNDSPHYGFWHTFWGLSEEEVAGLRAVWARLSARFDAGSGPLDGHRDPLAFLEHALADAPDWAAGARAVEDWYGWQATLETTDTPSFDSFRDAVGMGIPALLEDRNGGCLLAAGFLTTGGKEYLLTVDPAEAKPWLAAADTDSEQHGRYLLLPEAAPGRQAYLARAAEARRPVPALLDSRLPLPVGARFEEFVPGRYRATFLHSWRKSIRPYAEQLSAVLAPEPPETQRPVSFRMRFPEPFPALVGGALQEADAVVDIRESKFSLWSVDHIMLGPWIETEKGYQLSDKVLFKTEGVVEMELLPGTYWVWIRNLPVATLTVAPGDEGRDVDVRWADLPAPREVTVRLPEGTVLYDNRVTFIPYLHVAERRFLRYFSRATLPNGVERHPLTPENCDCSLQLFPGVFYVYDNHYFSEFDKPPMGKLIVPEGDIAGPIPLVPLTPEEANATVGDPKLPRPLEIDRAALGAPPFLR